jgi:hypothetical protein
MTPQGDGGVFVQAEMAETELETVKRSVNPFGSSVIRSQATDHSGISPTRRGFLLARRSADGARRLTA